MLCGVYHVNSDRAIKKKERAAEQFDNDRAGGGRTQWHVSSTSLFN